MSSCQIKIKNCRVTKSSQEEFLHETYINKLFNIDCVTFVVF